MLMDLDNAGSADNADKPYNADNTDNLYNTDNVDKNFTKWTFFTMKPFFR